MGEPLVRVTDRVDLQFDARQGQGLPEPRQHHDLLGVGIRPLEAQRLDVELMELAVSPLLRTLMAKHGAAGPDALRPVVGEIVFDRGAHDAGRGLWAKRERVAVQLVLEGIHLMLDHVRELTDAAYEQCRRFDDGHTHVAIAVLPEDRACGVLEALPQRCFFGQHVVHAAYGLQCGRHAGLRDRLDGDVFLAGRQVRSTGLAAISGAHIIVDQCLEFLGNVLTLQRDRLVPVDIDRCHRFFAGAG